MAREWTETTLGELGTLRNGINFSRAQEGHGLPVLKVKDFGDRFFAPDEGYDELDSEAARVSDAQFLEEGDTVIIRSNGNSALVGRSLYTRRFARPVTFSGFCIRFRPYLSSVNPRFAAYLIRSPIFRQRFSAYGSGTGIQNLSQGILGSMPVRLPPLAEQHAIAHILGTLDDKIELNRRMNETLEAMARALFKSWFVDFDPVRAKAAGRNPGLPKALADLFPSRLVDSELGEVPEGWEVATLGEHFDAMKGVSYKGSGLADSGMPLHNLNSVYEGGGYKYEGIKYYTGEYASRHTVAPGDVIVTNTEQGHERLLIGYAAIVPRAFGEAGIATHHIYRLRPRLGSPLTPMYLCYLLNSPQMHDIVSGYANGTTVNMLPIDGVEKPQIAVPPRALVRAFDKLATGCNSRREELVVESCTLTALRDTLLPKLISGELRTRNAAPALSSPP